MPNLLEKIFVTSGKFLSLDFLLRAIKLPSSVLLILVNLIPIIGIAVYKWNPYDIIILYWLENIVIGIYNFFRILLAKKVAESGRKNSSYAFFFLFHYGGFNLILWMILAFTVLNESSFVLNHDYTGLLVFFVALMISHGFSFFYNYIGKKEYLNVSAPLQMFGPYGRVVVIHLTILFGLGPSIYVSPSFIILFVILKIIFDLLAHANMHFALQKETEEHLPIESVPDVQKSINFIPTPVNTTEGKQE